MKSDLSPLEECYSCKHKRDIPGNAHIKCLKPDPSVFLGAASKGIRNGWFNYPSSFDPIWKPYKKCHNFEENAEFAELMRRADKDHRKTVRTDAAENMAIAVPGCEAVCRQIVAAIEEGKITQLSVNF
tara:strand:+ start:268 stop:651 length:384 start_codon:yes stop_codon:yes gene_type:complete